MSKELEALEKILNKFVEILLEVKCEKPNAVSVAYYSSSLRVAFYNELDLIEKALKDYQALKNKYDELETEYCDQQRSMLKYDEEKQKKLRALEIIKKKLLYIDFKLLLSSTDYEVYCFMVMNKNLAKEEYDLLKEILK